MDYGYIGDRVSFNNNTGCFNTIVHPTLADDKSQVLQWLSPLEPQKRHQHLRENRLGGVGQWIFRTSEFQRWNTGDDGSARSVVFCHGDPGVGKTHLSSLVIDHFYRKGQGIGVAGFYCDYLDGKEHTTSNMLGAMLKQLVGRGNISGDIRATFEDAKDHFGGVGPQVPELIDMLKTAIAQRQQVVLCVDGLDESLPVHRIGLLSSLRSLTREMLNLRLFLTGRPFIRSEVEKYFPGVDTISVSPTNDDIETFLRMKLDGDIESDAMDERLRADIMEVIPKTISDIFLLVSLTIEAILAETTIHRRREKLKQMSRGQDVGDIYNITFERIRAQKKDRSRLGMEAIMWVAHSERPFQPDELCQALGVEIGSKDLNIDNVPSIRTILNCGLGLITVDSSSSTVRLVYFTLQEYILANPTLFRSPHLAIAEVCLSYLNFSCIMDLPPTLSSQPQTAPFLEYASSHWGTHARRETNESVISLALSLLDQFDTHISCPLLLLKYAQDRRWPCPFDREGRPIRFSGLHGGALLGVAEIMASLLETKKWDLNATDGQGNTALGWASWKGHGCVVKQLLEEESVNPDIANKRGQTPLFYAAWNGHEGIVKMLLERNDLNPDTEDTNGVTPLLRATSHGHEVIVKMLLELKNVNPNTADNGGRTPFSWAAALGNEGIMRALLERNHVNPDTADADGRTPLSWAAENGHEGIVKMLLERNDINPDRVDKGGRTPFSWAAASGCGGIVKLLLERDDVNPDTVDKRGRAPFSWAAGLGCGGTVKALFEWKNLSPETADARSQTPLFWVTASGHEGIVKMLLERNDINPDTADEDGRTPFSWAAQNGHEGIVKILLERRNVNPDTADEYGRSPFSRAAENGHERIVKMLLERNNVNPETADKSGRTPFSWAAGLGYGGIVKALLKRNNVNPDAADKSGRTPFSWAAGNGRGGIVKMLLEQDDVNPDAADEGAGTPFSWAARHGHEGIVKMLLERNDVNPDTVDNRDQTPFSRAARNGYEGLAKMLSERTNVNPKTVDKSGRIPHPRIAGNPSTRSLPFSMGQHGLSAQSALISIDFLITEPSELPEPPLKRVRKF